MWSGLACTLPQSKEDTTHRVGDFSRVRYKESRKWEGVERGGGRGSLLFKLKEASDDEMRLLILKYSNLDVV